LLQECAAEAKKYNKVQSGNDIELDKYCSVSKTFNVHDNFILSANKVLKALCLQAEEKVSCF